MFLLYYVSSIFYIIWGVLNFLLLQNKKMLEIICASFLTLTCGLLLLSFKRMVDPVMVLLVIKFFFFLLIISLFFFGILDFSYTLSYTLHLDVYLLLIVLINLSNKFK